MVLLTFEVYAEITSSVSWGEAAIGFSVDEPLPEEIHGTNKVIGVVNIYVIGIAVKYGPTTVTANVGKGNHYVILGASPPPTLGDWTSYLRLRGLGVTVEGYKHNYPYIAFNVDEKGVARVIGWGTIAPGGAPIAEPGGGSIFGPGAVEAIGDMTVEIMENMMPMMLMIMMVNMMMSMVMGLVSGMTTI